MSICIFGIQSDLTYKAIVACFWNVLAQLEPWPRQHGHHRKFSESQMELFRVGEQKAFKVFYENKPKGLKFK